MASYNTVTVGSSATLILAPNNDRHSSPIVNTSSGAVFLGMDSGVTVSNGIPLAQNATFENSGQNEVWKGAIWGIVVSGSSDIRFWEF